MHIYPNSGLSGLWNALKLQIEEQGGKFYLSTSINELTYMPRKDKYIITHVVSNEGTVKPYDIFISTIPVQSLFKCLKIRDCDPAKPERTIRYRNDILVYLKVEFANVVHGQSFYIYSDNIAATRITNFSAFDTGRQNSFHIILLEFWCGSNDAIWHADENALLNEAINEISKTNIFKELKVLDINIKKIENAFQVPDLHFVDYKDKMFERLSAYQNLRVTGRNASVNFNYGMENAIEDGILVADKILADIKNK
jgi:protoporphyrinogen oxidase